jgi:hypothetical protein
VWSRFYMLAHTASKLLADLRMEGTHGKGRVEGEKIGAQFCANQAVTLKACRDQFSVSINEAPQS